MRFGLGQNAHAPFEQLAAELHAHVGFGRLCPSRDGWSLQGAEDVGNLEHLGIGARFAGYFRDAPPDWSTWTPFNVPMSDRNRVQVIDNSQFQAVDVVRRVYQPLGIDRLAHMMVLLSEGSLHVGWLGIWRERPFTRAERYRLQRTIPRLVRHLVAVNVFGGGDPSWQGLTSILEAIERPAFLVRANGVVEHANHSGRALYVGSSRTLMANLARSVNEGVSDAGATVTRLPIPGDKQLFLVVTRGGKDSSQVRVESVGAGWKLTPRQMDILRHVVRGRSNKEIGATLGVAEGTVELHITALLRKANVDSRSRLMAKVWET